MEISSIRLIKASITGDVKLATKSGSLGTKVIYFLNTYSTAKFTVNIDQSGQWYAWGRMFFESSGSPRSSFYLQVDNGPKLTFGGDNNSFDKWHWEGSGLSKLSLGNISAGSHTITIYGRAGESGPTVMLDQILLTSDASLIASDNIGQGSNSGNIVNAANNTILNGDVHLKTKTGSIASKVLYFLNTYSTAKFTINLDKSGQWYAWGRMFFESSGSPRSSFYIQVDNNAKLLFGGDDNSFNKWHWEGNKLNKLSLGNLSSGSHTITIYGVPGETGETVLLDQVLFTSDLAFFPTDNNVFNKSGNDNLNTKQSKTDIPENYTLSQNYPNPFNPSTTIKFSIPQDGLVLLKVYNILGAEVASLVNGNKPAGTYNVTFDASDLSSGVYLYKLITPDFAQTKKMLLVK